MFLNLQLYIERSVVSNINYHQPGDVLLTTEELYTRGTL